MSLRIGIIAEQKFVLIALEKDIPIFKPILDYYNTDFVIQKGKSLVRIQIKSTLKKDNKRNTYKINTRCGRSCKAYNNDAFDYLVVYIFELDTWYIIPKFEILNTCIRINPANKNNKWNKYKENWDLVL